MEDLDISVFCFGSVVICGSFLGLYRKAKLIQNDNINDSSVSTSDETMETSDTTNITDLENVPMWHDIRATVVDQIYNGTLLPTDDTVQQSHYEEFQTLINCSCSSDWKFRAEGAVNAIFAYVGDHPSLNNVILRLPKTSLDPHATTSKDGAQVKKEAKRYLGENETVHEFMRRSTRPPTLPPAIVSQIPDHGLFPSSATHFNEQVIAPIIHPYYLPKEIPIQVSSKLAVSLNQQLLEIPKPQRHVRFQHTQLDISEEALLKCTLMPDLSRSVVPPSYVTILNHSTETRQKLNVKAIGDTLAIEIKPKCHIVASNFPAKKIAAGTIHPIQAHVSRFEMHQQWKAMNDKIAKVSGYKPQDLCSNSYTRILRALYALIKTPQSNFRVAVADQTTDSIENALWESHQDFNDTTFTQKHCECTCCDTDIFVELLARVLHQESVLTNLSAAIETAATEEEAMNAYDEIAQANAQPSMTIKHRSMLGGEDESSDEEEIILPSTRIKKHKRYRPHHLYKDIVHVVSAIKNAAPKSQLARTFRSFLIGKTLRDCSLMMSFQRVALDTTQTSMNDVQTDTNKHNLDQMNPLYHKMGKNHNSNTTPDHVTCLGANQISTTRSSSSLIIPHMIVPTSRKHLQTSVHDKTVCVKTEQLTDTHRNSAQSSMSNTSTTVSTKIRDADEQHSQTARCQQSLLAHSGFVPLEETCPMHPNILGWSYSVSVADTDPRDIFAIPYYYAMDQAILQHYLNLLGGKKQ